MKNSVRFICLIAFFALVSVSCTHIPRKTKVQWPEKVDSMEAICDLHMSWRGMEYDGTTAIKIRYPDIFHIEIYGPFGETQVMIDKKEGHFLFSSRDETIRDEKVFNDRFGIRLEDFMEDITLRRYRENDENKHYVYVKRKDYLVIYELRGDLDRVCWRGVDGSICLNFIEVNFD